MANIFKAESSILVLVDYQVGTMQLIRTMSSDLALRNAVRLTTAAGILGMPIIFTTSQEDHIQGLLPPDLQKAAPEAYANRIPRTGVINAWADPKLVAAVKATGRTQVIMGGVTTDICLVFPSMSAVKDGFEVKAVMDASGSAYEMGEEMARLQMREAGVTLTTTNTMLAELVQDWSTTAGQKIGPIVNSAAPPMQLVA